MRIQIQLDDSEPDIVVFRTNVPAITKDISANAFEMSDIPAIKARNEILLSALQMHSAYWRKRIQDGSLPTLDRIRVDSMGDETWEFGT